jgi:ribosome-binding protein aMBF1 (putative translation factor)
VTYSLVVDKIYCGDPANGPDACSLCGDDWNGIHELAIQGWPKSNISICDACVKKMGRRLTKCK